MTLPEFKKQAEVKEVNTTNGWGFGGYYGKIYTSGIHRFRQAKWSYRHTKSTNYDGYFIEDKEVTKKEFIESISKI